MDKEKLEKKRQRLGKRLLALRGKNSLRSIEQSQNIRFEVLKSIEGGNKSYTIDSLLKYCEALGIDIYLTKREKKSRA